VRKGAGSGWWRRLAEAPALAGRQCSLILRRPTGQYIPSVGYLFAAKSVEACR
jgi:hypothetical protein